MRNLPAAACLALLSLIPLATTARAQSQDAQAKARAAAFFEALASGSPEKFEAMARENYTEQLLARDTPERRRERFDRIKSDFGQISLTGTNVQAPGVVLNIRGTSGFVGRVELGIEPASPYKISSLMIMVDRPEDEGEQLPPPPVNAAMTADDMGKAVDSYFAPLVGADKFTGVVLIAKDGSRLIEKAYGLADRDKKVRVTAGTRFNLGSINKIFTKAAIAQLLGQGKLALTDTIGKILPDYPNEQARAATVSQLLNHRAGIADFFGPDFNAAPKNTFRSNADYYRFVAAKPLLFAPGTKTQYCNGCYIVLGAIIERVAGVPYEQYVSEHVFKAAGMKTAGFFQSDRFPPDVAPGYTLRSPAARNQLKDNRALLGASGSAAGGAYATAADMLAFDNALREGRLLDAKMTAWMLEESSERVKGPRAGGDIGIAGGAPGCNAVMESDGTWTVIVLGNLDPPTAEQAGVAIARQLRK